MDQQPNSSTESAADAKTGAEQRAQPEADRIIFDGEPHAVEPRPGATPLDAVAEPAAGPAPEVSGEPSPAGVPTEPVLPSVSPPTAVFGAGCTSNGTPGVGFEAPAASPYVLPPTETLADRGVPGFSSRAEEAEEGAAAPPAVPVFADVPAALPAVPPAPGDPAPTFASEADAPPAVPSAYFPAGQPAPAPSGAGSSAPESSAFAPGPGMDGEPAFEEEPTDTGPNWMLAFVCSWAGVFSLFQGWELTHRAELVGLNRTYGVGGYLILGAGLVSFALEALFWGKGRRRQAIQMLLIVIPLLLVLAGVVALFLFKDPDPSKSRI